MVFEIIIGTTDIAKSRISNFHRYRIYDPLKPFEKRLFANIKEYAPFSYTWAGGLERWFDSKIELMKCLLRRWVISHNINSERHSAPQAQCKILNWVK
jgi:hypothetical protein